MKRFISVFLAFLILFFNVSCFYLDVWASSTTTAVTWTDEMLYAFELFMNSAGVRVTSKALPSVALAWEAQARVETPDFLDNLAEKSKDKTWWGQDSDSYKESLCNQWITSVRDFLNSDSCLGYGTTDFSFSPSLISYVLSSVNDELCKLDSYATDKRGYPVYIGLPPDLLGVDCEVFANLYSSGTPYILATYISSDTGSRRISGVSFGTDIVLNVTSTGNASVRVVGDSYTALSYKYASHTDQLVSVDVVPYLAGWNFGLGAVYMSSDVPIIFGVDGEKYISSVSFEDALVPEKIASAVLSLQASALDVVPVVAPSFTIPATSEELETVLKNIREADTPELLAKALADVGVLVGDYADNPPIVDVEPSLDGIAKGLSSILSAILSMPDKIIAGLKDLLISLFVPSPTYFNDKIDSLLVLLKSVLPFEEYLNLLEIIGDFSGGDLEDITITIMGATATVVSFGSFRDILPTVRSWVRGVFFVFMVIYYINQIYKLIRNARLYEGMFSSGKG